MKYVSPILGAHKAKTEVFQSRKLTYQQNFPLLDDCSELHLAIQI